MAIRVHLLLITNSALRGGCILLICAMLGCGKDSAKPMAHVSGTITIKDQSIPADAKGTIMFRPTTKGMAKTAGVPIVDGKYVSPETPVGEVLVVFSIQEPTGKMISNAGGPPFPEYRSIVPESSSQGIKVTITGDNSAQNFDLE